MDKRSKGRGGLIAPRVGITNFWYATAYFNGKQYRKSTDETSKMRAEAFLRKWLSEFDKGVSPANDPSKIRYGALRELYMNDYREQNHKSLMHNSESGEAYVCGLKWLDQFFDYDEAAEGKPHDKGVKANQITMELIGQFKAERQAEGAAPATINRALAALRRMFVLAVENKKLHYAPKIKMLPEPKQPRQGFLSPSDYQRLYDALAKEVKNHATGKVSRPFAYIQPLLQVGYSTGMRLGEIVNLRWANVDLSKKFIHLFAGETKNDEARDIPMIDGLPDLFEKLRRANPNAGENDLVFLNAEGEPIRSFIKAWRKACVAAAIPTKLNGRVEVSHFEKDGTYVGFLFHDLRRTAVSNMIDAGIDPLYAKAISGHKTDSVFTRYNIIRDEPLQEAGKKLSESLARKQKEATPVRLNEV
jgi:integrase